MMTICHGHSLPGDHVCTDLCSDPFTFTEIGRTFDPTVTKARILGAIRRLEPKWVDLRDGKRHDLPFMPGENIKQCAAEFKIPMQRIAWGTLGRYGFYGIEGRYRNGTYVTYFVDRGNDCTPVATGPVKEEAA